MGAARILIVEDDAILAVHLEEVLLQLGYQVAGLAATGEAAVESALNSKPDAILMDIRLRGDMTGIQAAQEIHKAANIPVVYVTAYTDEALLQQAKVASAYAYLTKPVRDRELRASLEMALYKHAVELRLEHLNQVLRAVRDINQLITREEDPQRLLDSACHILLRTRGYQSVWIGGLEDNRPKPMAYAGASKDLLDRIAAEASEEQIQKLPSVTAIRTMQPVICHDLLSDECYAAGREEAARLQFRSSAAVPLLSSGRLFGVLCVFADRTDVFDDEEMDLLQEVAKDIAFGLKTLEDEAARRKAERALHASEAKYRIVADNTHGWEFWLNPEDQYVYTSPSCKRITGYDPAEFMADPTLFRRIVHPDDRLMVDQHLHTEKQKEPSEGLEFRIVCKNGDVRWIGHVCQAVFDEKGHRIGTRGSNRDITARKQAEDQLRQRNKELAALNRIGQALSRLAPPSEIVELLYTVIGQVLDNRNLYIALYDEDGQSLSFPLYTIEGERRTRQSRRWANGLTEYVIRTKTPLLIARDQQGFIADQRIDLIGNLSKCFLAAPMRVGERVMGVIAIQDYEKEDVYGANHLELLGTLAAQAGIAFENARLYETVQKELEERKRAEQALGQSEQHLRTVLQTALDGFWIVGPEGRFLDVNEAYCTMSGYSRDEFLQMSIPDLEAGETPEETAGRIQQIKAQGSARFETRHRGKDGRIIDVEVSVRYIDLTGGQFVCFCRDITQRRRAEMELRESERKFRGLVEQSQDGIVLTDEHGTVIEWNAAEEKIAGLRKEQVAGRPIWEVQFQAFPREKQTPEALQRLKEITQDLYRTGQWPRLGQMIERQIESAGTHRTVQEVSFPIRTERGFMIASISRDVTVQKQAEEGLRQSEEKYRNIFENAAEGIFQSSPEGRFTSANFAMARVFGYPSPEQMMASITCIGDQIYADPGRRAELTRQLEETGKIENWESECLRQDGSRIWISENARAVKDTDGNLMHYEGFFHDVTARRHSEEELQRRAAHQAALNAVIGAATQAGANLHALLETGLDQTLRALGLEMGAAWLTAVPGIEQPVVVQGLPAEVATVMARVPTAEPSDLYRFATVTDWEAVSGPLAQAVVARLGIRASHLSPLLSGGKRIGALAVASPRPRAWSDEEVALVKAVGRQLGSAAERAQLFEETQQRAQQLALVYDAGLALNGVLDSQVLLKFLFTTAMKAVHADGMEFSRYDPAGNALEFEMAVGYGESSERSARERPVLSLEDDTALVCWVARSSTPLNVPDVSAPPFSIAVAPGICSGLWLPILRGDKLLGVLGVLSTRPDAFTAQDERLLALFANQAAVAMENARLFESEQSRRGELAALYDLSRALADADEFSAALDLIVRRAVEITRVTFARIVLVEGNDLVIRAAHPTRVLDRDLLVGSREPVAAHPLCQRALEQTEPVVLNSDDPEITPQDRDTLCLGVAKTVCVVPLRAGDHVLGLLILGAAGHRDREPFDEDKIRKARNISDGAASALRRLGLYEETERRLRRLEALHEIDTAITSSTDLRVSLHIILGHVVEQLHIAAADVLLFDPLTSSLKYANGYGFHTRIIEESRERLGEGLAGRAALERQTLYIPQVVKEGYALKRSRLIVKEGFVTYYGVPLVAKGKLKGVLEIFHRAPFEGDSEWMRTLETLALQTTVAIDNADLLEHLEQSYTELQVAYDSTIEGWSRALDLRDKETEGHTQRVTEISVQLARQMGIHESDLIHVRRGAMLHDIGKMGIPDHILHKPGPLNKDEWVLMRQHPVLAFELLSSIPYLRPALDIPYCHHEKWDGTGYPRGLKGEQIPLAARVFAIVDVWDALRSERPYREAWPDAKVRALLKGGSGTHFDPQVAKAFLDQLEGGVL